MTSHPVCLHALAEAALTALADAPGGRVARVATAIPPELHVQGDATWLQRVFDELLDNACRFSPPGEAVTVAAECQGHGALVSVTDGGPGLPAEQLERIFEPFYTGDTARHDRRSNGLGLALCRQIIASTAAASGPKALARAAARPSGSASPAQTALQ